MNEMQQGVFGELFCLIFDEEKWHFSIILLYFP